MKAVALLCLAGLVVGGPVWADTVYQVPPQVDAVSRKTCREERVPAREMATCVRMGNQLYMAFYSCHYAHVPDTWKCMQANVPDAIKYTDAHPHTLSAGDKAALRKQGYKGRF